MNFCAFYRYNSQLCNYYKYSRQMANVSRLLIMFVSFLKHTIDDLWRFPYANDKCETVSSFWKRPK